MDIGQIDKSKGEKEDVNAFQQRRPHNRSNQKHKQESDNERKLLNRRITNLSPSASRQSTPRDKKPESDVMQSCQATKILSPQEQIYLLCGSRWTLTRSWYIIWLMFKKLPQTFARHHKGGLLHLFRQTVSAKHYPIVHLCRSGSASTTGTQGPVAERKTPSKSKSQAGGMSSRCKKQLSMSIMTFLLVGST